MDVASRPIVKCLNPAFYLKAMCECSCANNLSITSHKPISKQFQICPSPLHLIVFFVVVVSCFVCFFCNQDANSVNAHFKASEQDFTVTVPSFKPSMLWTNSPITKTEVKLKTFYITCREQFIFLKVRTPEFHQFTSVKMMEMDKLQSSCGGKWQQDVWIFGLSPWWPAVRDSQN